MQIIGWAVFGLIAGAVAKLLMPGKDPGGIIVTILLGVAGALIGGFVGSKLGIKSGMFMSFVLAVVGAMVLLGVYRMMKGKTA
ncbi:MAG TPA: GlsB/YeaQ/YmgE family stress response membrane protein [Blastocatellia bacterium]|nr:GlsB/YeaQ/YmgE family stress response membrane protein [Blastocatellia bacterium]